MRCEARTLDDIRALGGNDADDERRFATAARVSEINLALYRAFVQPTVRAMTSAPMAEWMRRLHPLRLQYELFSGENPIMGAVQSMADHVRENRKPVNDANPFLQLQKNMSDQIVANLDAWRIMTETLSEKMFLSIYGSPMLQTAVGIDPTTSANKPSKNPLHRQLVQSRIAELKSRIGTRWTSRMPDPWHVVRRVWPGKRVDERGFAALRRLRTLHKHLPQLTLTEFKALVREQYFMLLIDEDATLAAIPDLLPADVDTRREAFSALLQIYRITGEPVGDGAERMQRISRLFGVEMDPPGDISARSGYQGRPELRGVMLRVKRESCMIPTVKAKLLEGKKGLVVGIANEQSIAWGCAAAFRALGAEVAVTYLNDKAKKYVEPLARELESKIVMPLDTREPGQMEAVFERIAKDWGELDFARPFHRIFTQRYIGWPCRRCAA